MSAAGTAARRRAALLGLAVALATGGLDQAHKLWMLGPFDIAARAPVPVMPGLDLTLVWNYGVSYGLFQQGSDAGRWALVAFTGLAIAALLVWLTRVGTAIGAVALGLVIGGAVGNGIDRIAYGAVADFFHIHAGSFSWYVFNIADVAIVAGVGLLLYEAALGKGRAGPA